MSGEYVIQDPYNDYAIRFIQHVHRSFGWKAVCYYTDTSDLRRNFHLFPQLGDPALVSASYRVSESGMARFIEHLRIDHDIRAVVPHKEPAVMNASRIAAALGLSWSQPRVLERFRHKESLKEHLRRVAPDLRMNESRLVDNPRQARTVADELGLDRFVLKPNDGFGNVNIGFFDRGTTQQQLSRFWGGSGRLLLEEYVGGLEYQCDGQVDAAGTVTVFDVMEYVRAEVNGRPNIKLGSGQVRHSSPLFAQIAEYTERVVRASGLRRSPFHAEVKVDERGPCLIECGARMVGMGQGPTINLMHAGALDVFDVAAHYYASDQDYGPIPTDWTVYDSHLVWQVSGAVTRTERVFNLQGIDDVESLPGFAFWIQRPYVGERLHETTDLFGRSFIAVIEGTDEAELQKRADYIRETVRWNTEPVRMTDRRVGAADLVRRKTGQLPSAKEWRMRKFT